MLLAAILFLDFWFEKLRLDGEGGYFPGYLHPTYPSSLLFFCFFTYRPQTTPQVKERVMSSLTDLRCQTNLP